MQVLINARILVKSLMNNQLSLHTGSADNHMMVIDAIGGDGPSLDVHLQVESYKKCRTRSVR